MISRIRVLVSACEMLAVCALWINPAPVLVHFDSGTETGPVSTVGLWASVIDELRESACVDAAIPLEPASRVSARSPGSSSNSSNWPRISSVSGASFQGLRPDENLVTPSRSSKDPTWTYTGPRGTGTRRCSR